MKLQPANLMSDNENNLYIAFVLDSCKVVMLSGVKRKCLLVMFVSALR